MTGPFHRRPHSYAFLLLASSILLPTPNGARAATEIIATRLAASSLSARYGAAVPLRPGGSGGTFLIPTATGIEARGSATGDSLFGSFRTAGDVAEVACAGSIAYLMAGDRGIIAVDASDSTNLVAIGAHDHLGRAEHGAFSAGSGTLAVGGGSTLHFLHENAPGALTLVETRTYGDGRGIVRIRARSDSFLVVSLRSVPTTRLFVSLYRVRSGAAPESLWEVPTNGVGALDLAWPDDIAFIAAGNSGIVPFDLGTRLFGSAVAVNGGKLVHSLSADAGVVVAIGEARTYAQFTRAGTKGQSLLNEVDRVCTIEPSEVAIVGSLAAISEADQVTVSDPDEIGRSLIEILDVTQPAQPSLLTTTGDGRVRRVVSDSGLAYVADYSGGMRIYRSGFADTSLVGGVTVGGGARVYDLALDPVRHRAFLASGAAGLTVVDVSDPAAPAVLGSLAMPGSSCSVAFIDSELVAVGRRGGIAGGVTFVNVTNPSAPVARGSVNTIEDPRALAVRDTVAFVAEPLQGLMSIRFGNPDAPGTLGPASQIGARDLDLRGTQLLVGLLDGGVQIVDVFQPTSPFLRSTLPTPPVFGVAQLGQTGLALLGDGGAVAIDLRNPDVPRVRGVVTVPGFARDAAWIGDTLLISASFGLERFRASALISADPALSIVIDSGALLPRADISWTESPPPGMVGWNVYRDAESPAQGVPASLGVRVNEALLTPASSSIADETIEAGNVYHYRLEAFFPDGSTLKVAEGTLSVPIGSGMGRPFPNPFRPHGGQALTVPFRVISSGGGKPVHLRVYDVSGRLLRDVVGSAPAGGGFGSLTWDGRDGRGRFAGDGIYFIQIEGAGIGDARQIVLLR